VWFLVGGGERLGLLFIEVLRLYVMLKMSELQTCLEVIESCARLFGHPLMRWRVPKDGLARVRVAVESLFVIVT
jgi:hypothetical protein